jgi:hypothetical protein
VDGRQQRQEVRRVDVGHLLEGQVGIDGTEIYLGGNLA